MWGNFSDKWNEVLNYQVLFLPNSVYKWLQKSRAVGAFAWSCVPSGKENVQLTWQRRNQIKLALRHFFMWWHQVAFIFLFTSQCKALINYLRILDTTLRELNTWYRLHVICYISFKGVIVLVGIFSPSFDPRFVMSELYPSRLLALTIWSFF